MSTLYQRIENLPAIAKQSLTPTKHITYILKLLRQNFPRIHFDIIRRNKRAAIVIISTEYTYVELHDIIIKYAINYLDCNNIIAELAAIPAKFIDNDQEASRCEEEQWAKEYTLSHLPMNEIIFESKILEMAKQL